MPTQEELGRTFRALHESGTFIIPNPWDQGSARILASMGFPAVATTSAGFAFSGRRIPPMTSLSFLAAGQNRSQPVFQNLLRMKVFYPQGLRSRPEESLLGDQPNNFTTADGYPSLRGFPFDRLKDLSEGCLLEVSQIYRHLCLPCWPVTGP